MSSNNLGDRAGRGVAWMGASRLIARLVDMLVLVILARLLTPGDFGVVALAAAVIAFVEIFRDLGLAQAAVQRHDLRPAHLNGLFWGSLGIGLSLALLLVVSASALGWLLDEASLAGIVTVLAPVLVLQSLGLVPSAIFEREMNFRPVAMRTIIGASAGALAGVGFALAGAGPYALVAKSLADAGVGTIALWIGSSFRPQFRLNLAEFRELFRFGLPVAGARLLETAQGRSDDLIIGRFMGSTALGAYSVAYRLYRILTETFVGVLGKVVAPTFALLQNDLPRLRSVYYSAIHHTALLAVPIFAGSACLAADLIPLIFGDQWDRSVPVMQALAFVGILHALRYFDSALLIALGMTGLNLRLRVITVTVTVAGFVLVLPLGSLVAFAAVYAAVGWFISAPLWLLVLRHRVGISPRKVFAVSWKTLFASAVMSASILGVSYLLGDPSPLVGTIVGFFTGVIVYVGLISIIDREGSRSVFQRVMGILGRGR
jgi:O-antigen/teichoic acid export membrane protein